MRNILKGATDQSVVIRIVDSGDGTPETGVTSATAGLDLKYRREGGATANLTESDLSALTDAHADGGLLHIGAGYYRVDVPDAAFATASNGVLVFGSATGMVVIGCYLHLVDYNPQDAVRLGLTALPNAAADAAGGLPISDAGGLDLDAQLVTKINDILTDTGTTLDGRLPAALTADGLMKSDTLRVGGTLQTAGDLVALLVIIDDFLDTEVAAIKAKTDQLTFTVSNQLDVNVQSINDTALLGNGAGTPWGPV